MKPVFSIVCSLVFYSLTAQNVQLERLMPSVEVDGAQLELAFAGGFNSPQFSTVDFNNDGREDIFVFDRVGNVAAAFVRQADNSLKLAPEMLKGFPSFIDWVLLRDFNDDGVMDIFTYNAHLASGVKVFVGTYAANRLVFEPFSTGNTPNILFFDIPGGQGSQIYVSKIDIPAIDDLDCDGDLDILTFNLSGGFIEFYQNRSVENGYGRDSLQFVLAENCYGGIYESGFTNELDLASAVGECASNLVGEDIVEERHTGSTLLTIDDDGDGDKDLILGDLSFGNLNRSINANNCTQAWMNEQDETYPSYDVPLDLPIFPAAYYIDTNGDAIRDLVVAPNLSINGIDHENIWLYRNIGSDDNPNFSFTKDDFLVGQMIDLGTGSSPALLDYNADGLMDLVVGNHSYYGELGTKNAKINLYENVGTSSQPAFKLVDEDFLDMAQFSTNSFSYAPTFGDLDGDGDMDALVGEINGKLFYIENTAGADNPVAFAAPVYNYMNIDIGQASTPQIIDLNRDGLVDIVLGEKGGNVNYFQNVGTPSSPQFGEDETIAPNVKRLGDVDTRMPGFTTGYSFPYFVDFMGEYRLFVGTQFGPIEVYDNIENNLEGGVFFQRSEAMAGLHEGSYVHPIFYDWDGDDFLDVVVGNFRGGLGYFASNILIDGAVNTRELSTQSILVFPNPAFSDFTVSWQDEGLVELALFNAMGQRVFVERRAVSPIEVSVRDLPKGVYFLRLLDEGGVLYRETVVVK